MLYASPVAYAPPADTFGNRKFATPSPALLSPISVLSVPEPAAFQNRSGSVAALHQFVCASAALVIMRSMLSNWAVLLAVAGESTPWTDVGSMYVPQIWCSIASRNLVLTYSRICSSVGVARLLWIPLSAAATLVFSHSCLR